MSEEKKGNQSQKQPEVEKTKSVDIGRLQDRQHTPISINEGYQPTDRLDTSNPPKDKVSNSSK